ncbi:MAG: hypothetical protein KAS02_01365 [Candidatus Pacebacteria bacterium]|nr:hypothetical protein [Candidatus Paceibacterota bacterium]
MNENSKKIITIIIVILFIGIFIYFIFFNKENNNNSSQNNVVSFPTDKVIDVNLGEDFNSLRNDPNYLNDSDVQAQIPILRKISDNPVSGAIIFRNNIKKDDFYTIRYMEKITGHIYETKTNSLTSERISNKTIPKINTTEWLNKDTLFFNYLDDDLIKTYSATLTSNATSTEMNLEGAYLQNDIQNIIYLDNDLFYLKDFGSDSKIILTDIQNTTPRELFTSPLQEWLIDNIDDVRVSFTTKTTENTLGYLFIYNSITERFSKILDKKLNLSTLLNKNLDVLYSHNIKSGPTLSLYNFEKEVSTNISITTFPEKCVWSKNNIDLYCSVPYQQLSNDSLENWYKGNILFSDDIWNINTDTDKIKNIIPLIDLEGEGIDATKLSLADNNDYLVFINKKDYSLWGLQIISNEISI